MFRLVVYREACISPILQFQPEGRRLIQPVIWKTASNFIFITFLVIIFLKNQLEHIDLKYYVKLKQSVHILNKK